MIPRYSDPEVASIWSEEAKYALWTEIELAHLAALGHPAVLDRPISLTQINWYEARVGHDVGGFLLALEGALGGESDEDQAHAQRFLHFGLTSSDLVDSANAIRMNRTTEYLIGWFDRLTKIIEDRPALRLPMNGRTHGQVASPTSIRHRWAVMPWPMAYDVPVMFTGAIGRRTNLPKDHGYKMVQLLGVNTTSRHTTQVLPRWHFVQALRGWVDWVGYCEQIATDIRVMSVLREVAESTKKVGSTAMPGKTNPIRSERICGLARLARSELAAVEAGQALWLDRDLSHSAVDRVVFEDLAHLTAYCLAEILDLIARIEVTPQPLEIGAYAEAFLQQVTLQWDVPRSEAYEAVRGAMGAGDPGLIAEAICERLGDPTGGSPYTFLEEVLAQVKEEDR